MTNSFSVLFLSSWYPTIEYPTHGIFIRNHALALSKEKNDEKKKYRIKEKRKKKEKNWKK
jgi:hypothetical protein